MCTLRLPNLVTKQIDKYKRHYLWIGVDINAKSGTDYQGSNLQTKKTRQTRGSSPSNLEQGVDDVEPTQNAQQT